MRLRLSNPWAAVIIVAGGIASYASGLWGGFLGDDIPQIVNATPVHSISHLPAFFSESTFYAGGGSTVLGGIYYKPLQTAAYALLYTVFGPHPFPFHVVQLALYMVSIYVLYQVLKEFIAPGAALLVALIFEVHPMNSQVVFAIASVQDVLFFLFGITAMWVLVGGRSFRRLIAVAGLLLLSLLSKETGILFVAVALVYLALFHGRVTVRFAVILIPPLVIYLLLRFHAVGNAHAMNAPIDRLDLAGRLTMIPSMVMFYLTKFLWPAGLAAGYHWIHPSITVGDFVLPLAVELIVAGLMISIGVRIRHTGKTAAFRAYVFFAAWLALGLAAHLQVIPLDFTVEEQWFYFGMAGLLAMVAVASTTLLIRPGRVTLTLATTLIIVLVPALAIRTALRGPNYADDYTLASHDITVSPEDFTDEAIIAQHDLALGDYLGAKDHAQRSIALFQYGDGYEVLGQADYALHDYAASEQAFVAALRYGDWAQWWEAAARSMVWYGNPADNENFIFHGLAKFPTDAKLWEYIAIIAYRNGETDHGRQAIANAYRYSQNAEISFVYSVIVSGRPLNIGPG